MRKLLIVAVCLELLTGWTAGAALAGPQESLQKLIAASMEIKKNELPKIVLTKEEEDELIDSFIATQKAKGLELTRQQAAIMIGQLAGFTGMGLQVGKAFGAGQNGGKK